MPNYHISHTSIALLLTASLSSTAMAAPSALPKTPTSVWAIDDQHVLFNVHPDQPSHVIQSVQVTGLLQQDQIVGIDFRVARGELYGLANSGRIYRMDTQSGQATLVNGSEPVAEMALGPYGFDFNPAADKLRVVGSHNKNMRLDPGNGAKVDFDKQMPDVQTDPDLAFAMTDQQASVFPDIVAAAYTYNANDSKLTTNYAIDRRTGMLLMQGSKEGISPSVSPNLGVLYTVGALGTGPIRDASFDISDISNTALAAMWPVDASLMQLMEINLETGHATPIGVLGNGAHVTGLAIEP